MVGYWPGSAVHQRATLSTIRFEDFEYSSFEGDDEDSLAWMGSGMIRAQVENTSTTGYLDDADIPPLPAIQALPSLPSSPSSLATTPFSIIEEVK
jgi:hypothetical protein